MFRTVMLGAMALVAPAAMAADAAQDVTDAAKKLGDAANYSWKTTSENAGGGGFNATIEGAAEKDGYTSLKMTFGDNNIEVAVKGGKGALKTEDGWKSSEEAANDENGPGRFLAAIVQNFKAPAAQAQDIVSKTKDLKQADDAYTAELTEEGAKQLATFRRGNNANGPQISNAKGTIKFWVKDGTLAKMEYHIQATMTVNGEDRDIDRTTTTEIKDVGSTKVEVPDDAKKKLP